MKRPERDTWDKAIEDRDIPHHKKGHLKDEKGMVGDQNENAIEHSEADEMEGHDERTGPGVQDGSRKTIE